MQANSSEITREQIRADKQVFADNLARKIELFEKVYAVKSDFKNVSQELFACYNDVFLLWTKIDGEGKKLFDKRKIISCAENLCKNKTDLYLSFAKVIFSDCFFDDTIRLLDQALEFEKEPKNLFDIYEMRGVSFLRKAEKEYLETHGKPSLENELYNMYLFENEVSSVGKNLEQAVVSLEKAVSLYSQENFKEPKNINKRTSLAPWFVLSYLLLINDTQPHEIKKRVLNKLPEGYCEVEPYGELSLLAKIISFYKDQNDSTTPEEKMREFNLGPGKFQHPVSQHIRGLLAMQNLDFVAAKKTFYEASKEYIAHPHFMEDISFGHLINALFYKEGFTYHNSVIDLANACIMQSSYEKKPAKKIALLEEALKQYKWVCATDSFAESCYGQNIAHYLLHNLTSGEVSAKHLELAIIYSSYHPPISAHYEDTEFLIQQVRLEPTRFLHGTNGKCDKDAKGFKIFQEIKKKYPQEPGFFFDFADLFSEGGFYKDAIVAYNDGISALDKNSRFFIDDAVGAYCAMANIYSVCGTDEEKYRDVFNQALVIAKGKTYADYYYWVPGIIAAEFNKALVIAKGTEYEDNIRKELATLCIRDFGNEKKTLEQICNIKDPKILANAVEEVKGFARKLAERHAEDLAERHAKREQQAYKKQKLQDVLDLAQKHYDSKEYENSIKYFEEANKICETSNAYEKIGYSHRELQNYEAAIEASEKVIEIEPKNSDAYWNLGYCYSKMDYHHDAIVFYGMSSYLKNYSSADLQSNLGLMYEKEGALSMAKAHFHEALELDPNNEAAKDGINRLKT